MKCLMLCICCQLRRPPRKNHITLNPTDGPTTANVKTFQTLRREDNFRLLQLHKGQSIDELSCELILASFSVATTPYVAISYAWGDPTIKHYIVCNGTMNLGITENVKVLLKHLRQPDEDSVISVDAVCIDQSNTMERRHQVTLMGQIYSRAQSVTVWLGPEADESGLLEEFLPEAKKVMCTVLNGHLPGDDFMRLTATKHNSPKWRALDKFFARPWFFRTWVLQEIVLSAEFNFLCGNFHWSMSDLVVFVYCLYYVYKKTRGLFSTILAGNRTLRGVNLVHSMLQVRFRKNSDTADGFVQILYKFQDSKANDPKDKVFAFLGLDEELGTHIDPNYEATTEQTFQNLTKELLHGNNRPEVLSPAGNRHNRGLLTLPSWVPDLTVKLLRSLSASLTWPTSYTKLGLSLSSKILHSRLLMSNCNCVPSDWMLLSTLQHLSHCLQRVPIPTTLLDHGSNKRCNYSTNPISPKRLMLSCALF